MSAKQYHSKEPPLTQPTIETTAVLLYIYIYIYIYFIINFSEEKYVLIITTIIMKSLIVMFRVRNQMIINQENYSYSHETLNRY